MADTTTTLVWKLRDEVSPTALKINNTLKLSLNDFIFRFK